MERLIKTLHSLDEIGKTNLGLMSQVTTDDDSQKVAKAMAVANIEAAVKLITASESKWPDSILKSKGNTDLKEVVLVDFGCDIPFSYQYAKKIALESEWRKELSKKSSKLFSLSNISLSYDSVPDIRNAVFPYGVPDNAIVYQALSSWSASSLGEYFELRVGYYIEVTYNSAQLQAWDNASDAMYNDRLKRQFAMYVAGNPGRGGMNIDTITLDTALSAEEQLVFDNVDISVTSPPDPNKPGWYRYKVWILGSKVEGADLDEFYFGLAGKRRKMGEVVRDNIRNRPYFATDGLYRTSALNYQTFDEKYERQERVIKELNSETNVRRMLLKELSDLSLI